VDGLNIQKVQAIAMIAKATEHECRGLKHKWFTKANNPKESKKNRNNVLSSPNGKCFSYNTPEHWARYCKALKKVFPNGLNR